MQTKLFEAFEIGGASPVDSTGRNPLASLHFESVLHGIADPSKHEGGKGVVVIRASKNAIYGAQSSEFWLRNGLMAISFSDLVRESSSHLVLPIDPCSREDTLLVQHLSRAMTAFVRLTQKSGQRFTGNRINDVGKRFEYMIAEALGKTFIEVSVLGRPGYPDCILNQGGRVTYLEIKTSASVPKESNKFFKTFSFSSGKKIKSDARHLLLKVQLEEEDNKIWKVVAWELRDLSTLKTRLKTEFNAGFGDLADVQLLGSSNETAHSLTMGGQSVLDEPVVAKLQRRGRRRSTG